MKKLPFLVLVAALAASAAHANPTRWFLERVQGDVGRLVIRELGLTEDIVVNRMNALEKERVEATIEHAAQTLAAGTHRPMLKVVRDSIALSRGQGSLDFVDALVVSPRTAMHDFIRGAYTSMEVEQVTTRIPFADPVVTPDGVELVTSSMARLPAHQFKSLRGLDIGIQQYTFGGTEFQLIDIAASRQAQRTMLFLVRDDGVGFLLSESAPAHGAFEANGSVLYLPESNFTINLRLFVR